MARRKRNPLPSDGWDTLDEMLGAYGYSNIIDALADAARLDAHELRKKRKDRDADRMVKFAEQIEKVVSYAHTHSIGGGLL